MVSTLKGQRYKKCDILTACPDVEMKKCEGYMMKLKP